MIRCPSDERLVQLLEEQLDRRELADIERHLERCDHCQETLEELTRERISLSSWRPWDDSPPTAEGVVRLGRGPTATPTAAPPRRSPADPAEPRRRGPSRRPRRPPGRGVRDPRPARAGGDGRGLPGPPARARPAGRPQDDPGRQPRRARAPGPVPDRGPGRGPAPPPQRGPDLRRRPGRRPALRRPGAARRREPGGPGRRHPPARAASRPSCWRPWPGPSPRRTGRGWSTAT